MSLTTRFPYLVNATLECKPSNDGGTNLFVTVRFGEDVFDYLIGKIVIAVTKIHLNLKLANCEAPDDSWSFDTPPGTNLRTKTKNTTRTKSKDNLALGFEASAGKGGVSTRFTGRARRQSENFEELRDSYDRTIALITASGNRRRPRWTLRAAPGDAVLDGSILKDQLLCKLVAADSTGSVTLQAQFPIEGIVFKRSGDNYKLPTNKLSILQLYIRKTIRDQVHELAAAQLPLENSDNGQTQTIH
jgi:hypothetical protein